MTASTPRQGQGWRSQAAERCLSGLRPTQEAVLRQELDRHVDKLCSPLTCPGWAAPECSKEPTGALKPLAEISIKTMLEKGKAPGIQNLARFLDRHAREADSSAFVAFVPDIFYFTQDEEVWANGLAVNALTLDPEIPRISVCQHELALNFIHPEIIDGKPLHATSPAARILYGFAVYLAQSILDEHELVGSALLDALLRIRLTKPVIPPMVVELLRSGLEQPVDSAPDKTLYTLCEELRREFQTSPFRLEHRWHAGVRHEWSQYSAQGRNKRTPQNEDRADTFTSASTPFTASFVADGVSTADLGEGKEAATLVEDAFRKQKYSLTTASDPLAKPEPPDFQTVQDKLTAILDQVRANACCAIAERLNEYQEREPTQVSFPMCSTLTAAIIWGNQAIIQSVGDSPAFLYQASLKRLIKLTVEHNRDLEGLRDQWRPDGERDEGRQLTRVIGGHMRSEGHFESRKDKPFNASISLDCGDILFLATDGLLSSLRQLTEKEKLQELERCIIQAEADDRPLKDIVIKLVTLAENALANDNITLNAIRVTKNPAEVPGRVMECQKKS